MHLVETLAAGVEGAQSGTATFFLRGTGTSAASHLYNEFEKLTQPGTNVITLDANGAAEVYTDVYCDVVLKTSGGATLRTITVGDNANCVEVISPSFTGTSYTGSPTAASQPVTLETVLDRWLTSAGAIDWKVLVNGVATNLSSALNQVAGLFLNVKSSTFGAVGDGSTDDTAAIQSAITAAGNGGSVIFFPPGTYKVSGLTIGINNCCFMGSGAGSSIIAGSASAVIVQITDHVFTGTKRFTNMGFKDLSGGTTAIEVQQTQTVEITGCTFDMTHLVNGVKRTSTAGITRVMVNDSTFMNLGASTTSALANASGDGQCQTLVNNSVFILSAGFTGATVQGPDFSITNCSFDGSSVTSGSYSHITPQSNIDHSIYLGTVTGCRFSDGGSSGFAFTFPNTGGSNCAFSESTNAFSGFVNNLTISGTGNEGTYKLPAGGIQNSIYLGSRLGRQNSLANSSSTTVTLSYAAYSRQFVTITHTNASALTVTIDAGLLAPVTGFVTVLNVSGNTRSITFGGNTASVANLTGVVFGYTNGSTWLAS